MCVFVCVCAWHLRGLLLPVLLPARRLLAGCVAASGLFAAAAVAAALLPTHAPTLHPTHKQQHNSNNNSNNNTATPTPQTRREVQPIVSRNRYRRDGTSAYQLLAEQQRPAAAKAGKERLQVWV